MADEESGEKEAIQPLIIPKPGDEQAERLASGKEVLDRGWWLMMVFHFASFAATLSLIFAHQMVYGMSILTLTILYGPKLFRAHTASMHGYEEQGRVVVLPAEIIELAMRAAPHLSEREVRQALREEFGFASTYLVQAVQDLKELGSGEDERKQIEAAVIAELRNVLPRELPPAKDEVEIRRVRLDKLYPRQSETRDGE